MATQDQRSVADAGMPEGLARTTRQGCGWWSGGGVGWAMLALGLWAGTRVCDAVTIEDLRTVKGLTPKKFASYFAEFQHVVHAEVQPAEVFLAKRAGDCDDYAVLADQVLGERGYRTRLVSVRMPGLLTHAVCYVTEDKVYLDYNNRVYALKLQRCGEGLREIASKVARSFNANWTSASEFTYRNGLKRMVETVVRTESP